MTTPMTQNFSALILPATIPQEDSLRQLLLYFETIFLYSPMEEIADLLPAEFRPLCCHYAPVAFGDGLTNFKQLIRDMTKNRAEYYGGGLSSLSAKASAVDDESVWRLIRRLAPQPATSATSDGSAHHETLLQARLLLKLAEVRALEEKEIEQALTEIDGQGQAMLHGLTEEDDEERAEIPALAHPDRRQTDDNLEKRLRAWAHLFLADPRRAQHWLLATTPEVLAILADHSTSKMNEGPNLVCSLPLPGSSLMGLSPAAYLREREAWRQEADDCLKALAIGLKDAATTGAFKTDDPLREQLAACHQKMPAWGGGPQATLDLYLLPVSLAGLFAKIAKVPVPESGASTLPHGLVAVVQPASAP